MAQNKHVSSQTGVSAVGTVVGEYSVGATADGLEFASPSPSELEKWFPTGGVKLSKRLEEFFTDLRLLRRIPLAYLVPDANLLPPESIRFFEVDQTWIDRVIDGVLSTSTIGTVDFFRTLTILQAIRDEFDLAPDGMSGMVIRSELVRRWPTMRVQGFATTGTAQPIEPLRAEAISRDIFVALFPGLPKRVHLREPFDGVRYGLEAVTSADGPDPGTAPDIDSYEVDRRRANGTSAGSAPLAVPMRSMEERTVNAVGLRNAVVAMIPHGWGGGVEGARAVALHLEQHPYVQVFVTTKAEPTGSDDPPPDGIVSLRHGRSFTLSFAEHALYQAQSGEE